MELHYVFKLKYAERWWWKYAGGGQVAGNKWNSYYFVKTWIIAASIPHYVFVAACFLAAMTSCKNCCCVLVVGSGRPID